MRELRRVRLPGGEKEWEVAGVSYPEGMLGACGVSYFLGLPEICLSVHANIADIAIQAKPCRKETFACDLPRRRVSTA